MALKRGEWLRPDESSSSEEADKLHVSQINLFTLMIGFNLERELFLDLLAFIGIPNGM